MAQNDLSNTTEDHKTATKDTGQSTGSASSAGSSSGGAANAGSGTAKQTTVEKVKAHATTLVGEATDAARTAANEGKNKASEALETVSKVVENAAQMVEDKVGPTYGNYARKAATGVSSLADSLQNKDIDDLIEDTRNFVRKQPMVAVGAAVAVGFVLTRLVKLGTPGNRDV